MYITIMVLHKEHPTYVDWSVALEEDLRTESLSETADYSRS